MNPLFVCPVEDGASFQYAVIVDPADREQKTKEHFQMSHGEWVSLTSLTCLSFCFPLCLSHSHLTLWVLTLFLSGVFLLVCPCAYSSFKTHCHLSIPSLSFLHVLFLPLSSCLSRETCARYSCVCDGKSMWQYPATTNTHPCQLMTLRGIPRCTSPWLPSWVPAESAVKSHTLAALPVQGTVEVTSATLDDTVLAASASHALSLSSIFTEYAERERERGEIEDWEIWEINWLCLQCSQSSHEWRGEMSVLKYQFIRVVCFLLFQLSTNHWVCLQNNRFLVFNS